jgi:hypothetical protein
VAIGDDPGDYRPWREGDPYGCSMSHRIGAGMPRCGPPVLAREVPYSQVRPGFTSRGTKVEVLCLNHVGARFVPGGAGALNARAVAEARQAVLDRHRAEYTDELAARRVGMLGEILAAVPEVLQARIALGRAAYRQARAS